MSGSIGIAAFLGFWGFWFLLVFGYFLGELSPKQIGVFLLLWVVGRLGLAYLPPPAPDLFSAYVAVLDVALVFAVFKGDVPLS